MNDPTLSIRQLAIGYGRHTVSHSLTAQLGCGTLCALLAPNGAGKSTLLRTLAALQPTLGGSIEWNGRPVGSYSPRELARRVSVVLTSRPDADALTATEVVAMGRLPHTSLFVPSTEADRRAVDRAMQLTHTAQFATRPVCSLSDGERQRVFIAKALAQEAGGILLDEPTAFLDFPSKIQALRLLADLAHTEGKTILMSTHDVELALRFADVVWVLHSDGVCAGTPQALALSGDIARFCCTDGVDFDAETMRFVIH